MKRITTIFMTLLSVVLTASCSKALLDGEGGGTGTYDLVISGIVSDNTDQTPLEGIRLSFIARSKSLGKYNLRVYTDSKGVYQIYMPDLEGALQCDIIAEDMNGEYDSQTCRLAVDKSGPSLVGNTFYVNDLNMTLNKIR